MKSILTIIFVTLLFAACTTRNSSDFSGDLKIGQLIEGTLEKETPDSFNLNFSDDTYLYGVVNQISVDVIVTVYDSIGNKMRTFDGPGEGPEVFYMEITGAGDYLIEVAPFEDETGDYSIELKVVEPIATSAVQRADQLFTPFTGDDVPGGVVGIIQDGKLLFSKAYGMANLTHQVSFTVHTPTNIGSVSKQFTATAILLLEQEGKLSLDDDIRIHIPELPDLGELIKIRNLMNHTNGLREVYNLMPMTGWKGEDALRSEDVISMLTKQKELQALPGEEFNYNNSAFIMLAEIVKRKTDIDFPEWMKENLFGPLGMTESVVRTDKHTIIPGASQGYVVSADGYKEAGDLAAAYGAGGIYTTVGDFAKWLGNFNTAVLGGEELISKLVTPDTLINGDTMNYAFGIGVGEFKGLKMYSHGGADIAHRAQLVYFPEIEAGVAVMSNHGSFPAGQVAFDLAELFFEEEIDADPEEEEEEASTDSEEAIVSEAQLSAYAGKYKVVSMGITIEYKLNKGNLVFTMDGQDDALMIPISDTEFRYQVSESTLKFICNAEGKVEKAIHTQEGNEITIIPFDQYKPSAEELRAFEGRYLSDELETFYTLAVKDSTLTLLIMNTEDVALSPIEKDSFKSDVYFLNEILFVRNGKGEVVSFEASNGRTKGILFEKL